MIEIKRASVRDVSLIVGLWKEFMHCHDGSVLKKNEKLREYTSKKENAASNFRNYLKKRIISGNAACFIAFVSGEPVGFVFVYLKRNIPVFLIDRLGYISDLFVLPRFQGRGISSRLKDSAFSWCRGKGLKHVSLMVYCDNPDARAIYRKWGFFEYKVELLKKI